MLAWLKQVFGKNREATTSEVLDAYGALLEGYPGFIMDVTMLPQPKPQMKVLLKTLYGLTSDPKLQSLFTGGFMSLANFQEGVGPNAIDPNIVPDDFVSQGLEGIRRLASDPAFSAKLERFNFWLRASVKEGSELDREWAGFLRGDPIYGFGSSMRHLCSTELPLTPGNACDTRKLP